MDDTYAIMLAAGKGTRMKSALHKVLHPVCGKPMAALVLDSLECIGARRIVTIVGHGADEVERVLGARTEYALQESQLGTAHAVQQAEPLLGELNGTTLVICGDTPLIRPETLESLLAAHRTTGAKATILTAQADDPSGYGRIIRAADGSVARIVEQKDASEDELAVAEVNTGTYCFDNRALFAALRSVTNDNAQGEFYLPDAIAILKRGGATVSALACRDMEEMLGINDRVALAHAERALKRRINEAHMRSGVTIQDPEATYISADARIEADAVLLPGTVIEGVSTIGAGAVIGPNTHIRNSAIGAEATVHSSVITDSSIGARTSVGPFAHIRPGSSIGSEVKIGNFVEVKKSQIGDGAKLSHLSYMGDAIIGERANIGCGAISVNYDGRRKHVTEIGADAFIGCNANLIAPVQVEAGSYVAAGTTVTDTVPAGSLAIGRVRQQTKEGYMKAKGFDQKGGAQ